MKRLRIDNEHVIRIAILQEIRRSEESRYDHRLHGLLLVSGGMTCYDVARQFDQDATTIQRWVNRFEKDGFAGLQDRERSGRTSALTPKQLKSLDADLRTNPRTFGYSNTLWDGKLLAHHLSKQYQVALGVRQCQRIFHSLGFRRRKPRPVIAHADPVAQTAFKKTAKDGSGNRP
jgi:transposase